jgi:hypothetical protein
VLRSNKLKLLYEKIIPGFFCSHYREFFLPV